jgi:acyl dehydratase
MTLLKPDVEIGFRATGPTKTATPYRTRLFSGGWPRTEGWPAKNVHTDEEFARATGLAGRNASGAMMQGYLAELMVDMFGESWLSGGSFSLKFVHQVGMGDSVTAEATVTGLRNSEQGIAVELDVSCKNQHGQVVTVGTATGTVAAS